MGTSDLFWTQQIASKMFRFKARIARNSPLLRSFATQKLDILEVRYKFMNRSEVP